MPEAVSENESQGAFPKERSADAPETAPTLFRTAIFSMPVAASLQEKSLLVKSDCSCKELVERIRDQGVSSALILGKRGRLVGIVTEHDIARRLAYQTAEERPVSEIMSSPVITIRDNELLYYAISLMRRHRLQHLPVVDGNGHPYGTIRLSDALIRASGQLLEEVSWLSQEPTLEGMQAVKRAEVKLATNLFHENLRAPDIQAALSRIDKHLNQQALELVIAGMMKEGYGPPPLPFAMIVMGSVGRGESFLNPDQDNGFILDDYPDSDHGQIDAWFCRCAERLAIQLEAIGFSMCGGYVMAKNPIWRKSISQWREQINYWMSGKNRYAASYADIFFDFSWVYGERDLVETLRDFIVEIIPQKHEFLYSLYYSHQPSVALGWFNRLLVEHKSGEHKGKIDLKHFGTLPLVHCLRIQALRHGVPETSSRSRIDRLRDRGCLNKNSADYLHFAFRHITGLMLRQQIEDLGAGKPASKYVHPKKLTGRELDMLIDSFKAIQDLQQQLQVEFTGNIF